MAIIRWKVPRAIALSQHFLRVYSTNLYALKPFHKKLKGYSLPFSAENAFRSGPASNLEKSYQIDCKFHLHRDRDKQEFSVAE
jgi:hypothetical protein